MIQLLGRGLGINQRLIKADQEDLQADLRANYTEMRAKLKPMLAGPRRDEQQFTLDDFANSVEDGSNEPTIGFLNDLVPIDSDVEQSTA